MVLLKIAQQNYSYSKCYKFWSTELIRGNYIDIIYFDYVKGFNSVGHPKLLINLNNYGITGNLLYWISNFINVTPKMIE